MDESSEKPKNALEIPADKMLKHTIREHLQMIIYFCDKEIELDNAKRFIGIEHEVRVLSNILDIANHLIHCPMRDKCPIMHPSLNKPLSETGG